MSIPSSRRADLAIFSLFFFFSGAAGLIYEVLWMRQFGFVMGNTTVSLSAVLTAFMGGLAIGSWIGGKIADRRGDHLRLYGILEALIGLYALCVPALMMHRYFRSRVEGFLVEMEQQAIKLVEVVHGDRKN
ncbi:MAG: spermidine synthase [candidate division BRC1 bacterium ADurb.BinA364]|nr:MAG: spermidine synthase [candidate division BRC1 bacterium ADurb.BinA364]